jgi:hypothetical protein
MILIKIKEHLQLVKGYKSYEDVSLIVKSKSINPLSISKDAPINKDGVFFSA